MVRAQHIDLKQFDCMVNFYVSLASQITLSFASLMHAVIIFVLSKAVSVLARK